MSRIMRFLAVCSGLLHTAFGSSPTRRLDEEMLEGAVGRKWTLFAKSLPVVVLTIWILVWVWAKLFGAEDGAEDPFAWWRDMFQGSGGTQK